MFMVLLESDLIETSTWGTIKSKIGHIIEDLDNDHFPSFCNHGDGGSTAMERAAMLLTARLGYQSTNGQLANSSVGCQRRRQLHRDCSGAAF
ncbi:hypothetical protein SASPL_118235 [Salvia splendens]|uniref:Uncharacterized protein n=1 Tax=Salvia splendens TaxID=180675 RepID=A0A8X8ZYI3_SALSN|nr:hypothetical protein SASPL_118235 [Salvia splendens]